MSVTLLVNREMRFVLALMVLATMLALLIILRAAPPPLAQGPYDAVAGGTSGQRVESDRIPGYGTHDQACPPVRECGP
jgi:hypothetical protein